MEEKLKTLKDLHLGCEGYEPENERIRNALQKEVINWIKEINILLDEAHYFLYGKTLDYVKKNIKTFLEEFIKKTNTLTSLKNGLPCRAFYMDRVQDYKIITKDFSNKNELSAYVMVYDTYREIYELESIFNSLLSIKFTLINMFNIDRKIKK